MMHFLTQYLLSPLCSIISIFFSLKLNGAIIIAIKLAVHDCTALVKSSTYVCTVGNQEGNTYEVLTTRLHAVKYYQN